MRIIANRIANAIQQNRSIRIGNTAYDVSAGIVTLHGYRILYRVNDHFRIDTRTIMHWPTVTTKSRINDISRAMGGRSILFSKDFILYYTAISGSKIPVESFDNDLFAFAAIQ